MALQPKPKLISSIAAKCGQPNHVVRAVLDSQDEAVIEALTEGLDVRIGNIGTVKTVERAERTAKNPNTGEPLTVPAHTAPKFAFASAVKEALREKK